jgi:hypothetical protein
MAAQRHAEHVCGGGRSLCDLPCPMPSGYTASAHYVHAQRDGIRSRIAGRPQHTMARRRRCATAVEGLRGRARGIRHKRQRACRQVPPWTCESVSADAKAAHEHAPPCDIDRHGVLMRSNEDQSCCVKRPASAEAEWTPQRAASRMKSIRVNCKRQSWRVHR